MREGEREREKTANMKRFCVAHIKFRCFFLLLFACAFMNARTMNELAEEVSLNEKSA